MQDYDSDFIKLINETYFIFHFVLFLLLCHYNNNYYNNYNYFFSSDTVMPSLTGFVVGLALNYQMIDRLINFFYELLVLVCVIL